MGNWYPKAFDAAFEADIDVLVDTLDAYLVDNSYTYSNAHDFASDVDSGAILATATLTGVTSAFSGDVWTLDANDITFTSVPSGDTAYYVIIFKNTGNTATSPLISYNTLGTPTPTNGGNITSQVNASGIATVDVTP